MKGRRTAGDRRVVIPRGGRDVVAAPGPRLGDRDAALAELKAKGRHPVPASDITPQQGFNLNGAAEWDRYRTAFRNETKQAAE